MIQLSKYKRIFKLLGILLLAVYSLASCDIKKVVLSLGGVEYVKPINKSRTTFESHDCETNYELNQFYSSSKDIVNLQINNDINVKNIDLVDVSLSGFSNAFINYPSVFLKNEIPKFILYKRLKIGA